MDQPAPDRTQPAPGGRPGRRALLLGGLAAALAGIGGAGTAALVRAGVVAGPDQVARLTGACGVPDPDPAGATATPGPLVEGTLASARRGREVGWAVAYPPGSQPGQDLPLCLVLHGRGADHRTAFDGLRLHEHLAAAAVGGVQPFALAAADGGDGYWHARASGDDPMGMLTAELLPLLAGRGLRTGRVGVLGWSMGGYGALLLGISEPGLVAAVAASSPALWTDFTDASPGAFDGPQDWTEHDVIGRAAELRVPVRVDCGSGDPFVGATRALGRRLGPGATVEVEAGCHDAAFWRAHAPAQLRLVGQALA
jgi:enterochelin esterase-like enzyme